MAAQVVIIGDSISDGYTPLVRELLGAKEIVIAQHFAGDSAQLLAGLPQVTPVPTPVGLRQCPRRGCKSNPPCGWVAGSPELIQFNCGLHDARFYRASRTYQQPIADYDSNLRRIVAWLQAHTRAGLLWASTTPVITERITVEYVRYPADIITYNAVAAEIMGAAHIPINDLYAVIASDSISDCLSEDGVHMTERGNALLAEAVARAILDQSAQKGMSLTRSD